jgi:hypothetical protein
MVDGRRIGKDTAGRSHSLTEVQLWYVFEGLRNTIESLSQCSQCSSQDLNQTHSGTSPEQYFQANLFWAANNRQYQVIYICDEVHGILYMKKSIYSIVKVKLVM